VRKFEKHVTNSVKYIKKIEKLSKLYRIWKYKKKLAKNVEKLSEKMIKMARYLNLTSDFFLEISATWCEISRKQYLLVKNAPTCVIRSKTVKIRPAEQTEKSKKN
jgi:hypothetical protein